MIFKIVWTKLIWCHLLMYYFYYMRHSSDLQHITWVPKFERFAVP